MKFLKIILASLYFLVLLYLVFFPNSRRYVTYRFVNIIPLKNTVRTFNSLPMKDSREVNNFYYNLFGNILLFIPFSLVLLSVFNIRENKSVLLSAFLVSVLIECFQYIFKIGVADIDDVLLNTIGASLGIFLYRTFKRSY